MTTILCDVRAGVMIADSYQEHPGAIRILSSRKIVRTEAGICAWSGRHDMGLLWLEWLSDGGERDKRPALTDTSCLHLAPTGQLWLYGESCVPMEIAEPYYAIGSGLELALMAMYCGKTPHEAMRAVCHFNTYTAPPFVSYSLKDAEATVYAT